MYIRKISIFKAQGGISEGSNPLMLTHLNELVLATAMVAALIRRTFSFFQHLATFN